ncbi:hypothetical protein [Roseimaritima sediminicola]|uniref:hypothetical protein n=1 Tax=Roseimaritima sediminicola TaxID=2662066 RepID=UPI001386B718|nr:hypothetical protein [Roseimaritima sediminicola]
MIIWTRDNRELREDVLRLEAELGRMEIDDVDAIYIVAIEEPIVPPEVAPHVDLLWQFRCYLPPGYDFQTMRGGGRVSESGMYFQGGFGSSRSSPRPEPYHELLTISLRRQDDRLVCFYSFGGSSVSGTWNVDLDSENLVVETLASPGGPAQSFDQSTILPILKAYDPNTAEVKEINGQSITTYAGGIVVVCPRKLDPEFEQLRRGRTPDGFQASSLAEGQRQ